jgi:hypothetical protein
MIVFVVLESKVGVRFVVDSFVFEFCFVDVVVVVVVVVMVVDDVVGEGFGVLSRQHKTFAGQTTQLGGHTFINKIGLKLTSAFS